MSPAERRGLGTQVLIILRRDVGRMPSDLAEMTGATMADMRSACWGLYHRKQLDWCGPYAVLRVGTRRPT